MKKLNQILSICTIVLIILSTSNSASAQWQDDLSIDGKVGIGTTTEPSEKLEVVGNVKADTLFGDGSKLTGVVTTEDDPTFSSSAASSITDAGSNKVITTAERDSLATALQTEVDPFYTAASENIVFRDTVNTFTANQRINAPNELRFYNAENNNWSYLRNYQTGPGLAGLEISSGTMSFKIPHSGDLTWEDNNIYHSGNLINVSQLTNDAGYVTSETEKVGSNTLNYLSKWDGSKLVTSSVYDNGNVGIGTTSPDFKFEIEDDGDGIIANFKGTGVEGGGRAVKIGIGNTNVPELNSYSASIGTTASISASSKFNIFNDGGGNLGSSGVSIWTQSNDGNLYERVFVNRFGYVGIGTTIPEALLHINAGNIKLESNNDGNTGVLRMYDSAGSECGQVYGSANDLRIYSGTDILLNPISSVGIGISDPQQKLHVARKDGTIQLRLQRTNSNIGYTDIGSDGNGLHFWVGEYDGIGNQEMTINQNGNVGIGTPNPGEKLEVNGTASYTSSNQMGENDAAFASKKYVDDKFASMQAAPTQSIKSLSTSEINKETNNETEELNNRIEVLEHEIEELKQLLSSKILIQNVNNDVFDNNTAELYQNTPNPFTQQTEIRYYLSHEIETATILIFDMTGKQLKSYQLTARGNNQITINGNEFNTGMYIYSLIADAKLIDTKKMILTAQ